MNQTCQKNNLNPPCPVAFSKLDKGNGEFNCGSCKKDLVNFRGKSFDKIKNKSTADTCGIFNHDQVKPFNNFGFFKRSVFKTLTVLSLMGFNVKPLPANAISFESHSTTETQTLLTSTEGGDDDSKKSKRRRRRGRWNPFRKKRKEFPIIGCPSF